jgi:hypothetical protein
MLIPELETIGPIERRAPDGIVLFLASVRGSLAEQHFADFVVRALVQQKPGASFGR